MLVPATPSRERLPEGPLDPFEHRPVTALRNRAPEDVLPAIRIDDRTWRADLPPRPSYRLALEMLNANGQSE